MESIRQIVEQICNDEASMKRFFGPEKRVGAPPDPRRKMYADRFGLSEPVCNHMTKQLLAQLDACKSDEERRLILGVKENGE